jgi:hypothetical protein
MQDVDWTPDLAADIAEADGVGALGERHWRAIAAYRELAASDGRPPSLARISAACGLSIAELEELFHGAAQIALPEIAGIPPRRS